MKFIFLEFNKTALHLAFQNNNIEIIKLFLSNNNVDLNAKYVLF